MTKAELIDAILNNDIAPEGISRKAVQAVFESTFEEIKNAAKKDGKISIPGFGTFTKKERAARDGRNPQTGKEIKIEARDVVKFSPGKKLKESV